MTTDCSVEYAKADFTHLYNRPDPREYYRVLGALEYQIPEHARPVFNAVRRAQLAAAPADQGPILDICCSYGINAALLTTDLTRLALYERYSDDSLSGLDAEAMADADHAFYSEHRLPEAPEVLGLDVSAEAVAYTTQVGLHTDGWVENLEEDEPSAELVAGLRDVSLFTITGGVGYVTERTFDRLVSALPDGRKPWIAAFVLRMYPYDSIAETLAGHGMVTEKLSGTTFRQRRFDSQEEQDTAVRTVRALGLDTWGLEEDGWYHCDLFLSRPADDAAALPLEQLVRTAD